MRKGPMRPRASAPLPAGSTRRRSWDESTDDFDPQFIIEYEVYVNGVYDHSTALRYTRTIVYGTRNGDNTFSVQAVDTAGNKSPAAVVTLPLDCF